MRIAVMNATKVSENYPIPVLTSPSVSLRLLRDEIIRRRSNANET